MPSIARRAVGLIASTFANHCGDDLCHRIWGGRHQTVLKFANDVDIPNDNRLLSLPVTRIPVMYYILLQEDPVSLQNLHHGRYRIAEHALPN